MQAPSLGDQGFRFFGARVTRVCEQLNMGAGNPTLGPLGEQSAFLTAYPSLQPWGAFKQAEMPGNIADAPDTLSSHRSLFSVCASAIQRPSWTSSPCAVVECQG